MHNVSMVAVERTINHVALKREQTQCLQIAKRRSLNWAKQAISTWECMLPSICIYYIWKVKLGYNYLLAQPWIQA